MRVKLLLSLLLVTSLTWAQDISFNQASLDFNGFDPIHQGTSLTFGPDERLYVAQLNGDIKVYSILQSAVNTYAVEGVEVLNFVKSIPNYDDTGQPAFDGRSNRQITGITVVGTASQPVIYVTSSDPKWGGPSGDKLLDTNSGIITSITWTGEEWEAIDLVRGLPRSEENHSTNNLEFTTIKGKPYLLVASGGLTNAGAPSKNFAYITEYALAAAILSVDLEAIQSLPTLVDERSGRKFKYDIPTLDDPSRPNKNGIYDPNHPDYDGIDVGDPFGGNDGLNMGMVVEGGPVQIFSGGFRNSYDLVVTEKGMVYATENGANINWGGLPKGEGDPNTVSNDYDPAEPGGSPLNPSASGESVDNQDHLLLITTHLEGYEFGAFYAGHPTPIRANPGSPYPKGAEFPYEPGGAGLFTKFVGDDNNWANVSPLFEPKDTFRTKILKPVAPGAVGFQEYAANSLPANWPPVPMSLANPAEADFIAPTLPNPNGPQPEIVTVFPNNSNGIDEYTASNFQGAIKGALIVGKNGGDLHLVKLNEDGSLKEVEFNKWNMNGGNALGIACNGDDDIFPGTIWVATFDNRIMVLTPADDVFCIDQDDPDFDPLADYDHDGYTNQDEIDNGTDYCSGASIPNDYDKDFVSDLNDLDDDGDGILDEDDPFQLGDPRDLPIENQLFTNQTDNRGRQSGYLGLGLTGFMNNGAPNPNWLNWVDKPENPGPNDIYGGTAGAIQVSMLGGTANGTHNSQEKGFQFGVNVGKETGPFIIESGLIGLSSPGQLYDFDGDGEVGIQIGDGTQSNFVKFVFTKQELLVVQELEDVPQPDALILPIAPGDRPGSNTLVTLSFEVDPIKGEIEPKMKLGDSDAVSLGVMEAKGKIKDAIQKREVPLAIGIYGSSHNYEKSFIGVWNYFSVIGEQPFIIRKLSDLNRLMGDPDHQINLNEYFDDNNGVNKLTYSVEQNTNPSIGAQIEENLLRLTFPNDEIDSDITIRATDENGYYVEQTFNVFVEQDVEIILRINAGGPVINASDSPNPQWLANNASGAHQTEKYSLDDSRSATNSFPLEKRHSSIPSYIDDDTYLKIFQHERHTVNQSMTYKIPLPNGDYLVNIYMGNGFSGTSTVLSRFFNISIEGKLVENQIDLIASFGHQVGGMKQYPVTLQDGVLDISFIKQKENPLVNGIEIIGKPIQTPIIVEPIKDLINFAGHELDGSMFVAASGGDGNLNFTAEGLPPGVFIEPTNGTIYGAIAEDALANSPYRVRVVVDDDDAISSDARSFNFTWTISPPLTSQRWHAKNESQSYAGRHENSFVQAGNRFYLMGGRESSRTVEIYDYSKDEWKALSNITPVSLNHFQAVEYQGFIWVIGAFKTNNFPDEEPAENIWIFDPSEEVWLKGPEIPVQRRRGSAGLVVFNDKFYVVNGNKLGHNGQYVNYFDSFDPYTGEWEILEPSPRPRDHFFATVIGNEMYVASGRLSGGDGGTFGPVIPEVDVYNFSTKTWTTLPEDQNIPTPRAGATSNNYLGNLIIAGGEVPGVNDALATTEMYDPKVKRWSVLHPMNFMRHGTQAIVSGKGLYVLAGSPKRGGGNQKNMEFFGFDQPAGDPLIKSSLLIQDTLMLKSGVVSKLPIKVKDGNMGEVIHSIAVTGSDSEDYLIHSELPSRQVLWQAGREMEVEIEYTGQSEESTANLEIAFGNGKVKKVLLMGDGVYEQVNVSLNAGSNSTVSYQGVSFVGDNSMPSLYTSSRTNSNGSASTIPLYQTERFAANLLYSIPLPNGIYTVTTYHNELWFGKRDGVEEGPGKRVYDILIEGELVKEKLDLYVENGNEPLALTFENIVVQDGQLNLNLVASTNNASISGLHIENQGPLLSKPISRPTANVSSGPAPLEVEFDAGDSPGVPPLQYEWDFGDGSLSNEPNPTHIFVQPGEYTVALKVTDGNGVSDQKLLKVTVQDGSPAFTLFINAGSSNTVNYEGEEYKGDANFPSYFSSNRTYANASASPYPLFNSERFDRNLYYTIPLENGTYTVRTYHNELWFGKSGPEATAGQRVYDILVEGELKIPDFDLFVANNNLPMIHTFEKVEVKDGVLNLSLIGKANNASISGISILSESGSMVQPTIELSASVVSGTLPLEVLFNVNASNFEEPVQYSWDFGDGNFSTEQNPLHTYLQAGEYIASVTVSDELDGSVSKELTITVFEDTSPITPEYSLYLNVGTSNSTSYEGNDYVGDGNFPGYYSSNRTFSNGSASSFPLFNTERFDRNMSFTIPLDNGVYTVNTYHNELWFGLSGPEATAGQRVYSIFIEDELVKQNFDLFVVNGNKPYINTFENIEVTDGELHINLVASANNASLTGLSIISRKGEIELPIPGFQASVEEGVAPLQVMFDASESTGIDPLSFKWEFGDGTSSSSPMVEKTFDQVGDYQVILTVTDGKGNSNSTQKTIVVTEPGELFKLFLNAGTLNNASYENRTYQGDAQFDNIYNSTRTSSNSTASSFPLFNTERWGRNLSYTIPVGNGVYTVRTYHNELWFGKGGPEAKPGQRVFDIYLEGDLVKDNFDIFVEGNNAPTIFNFENIEVSDGILNIDLVGIENNGTLSGLAILEQRGISEGSNLRLKVEEEPTGTTMQELINLSFKLNPNPAALHTKVSWDARIRPHGLMLYDMTGRLVLYRDLKGSGESEVEIPLNLIRQGMYMITIMGSEGVMKRMKLVVEK